MKNLLKILLVSVLLFSCSKDDDSVFEESVVVENVIQDGIYLGRSGNISYEANVSGKNLDLIVIEISSNSELENVLIEDFETFVESNQFCVENCYYGFNKTETFLNFKMLYNRILIDVNLIKE